MKINLKIDKKMFIIFSCSSSPLFLCRCFALSESLLVLLAEAATNAALLVGLIVGGFGDGATECACQQQLGSQFTGVSEVQWRRLLVGA